MRNSAYIQEQLMEGLLELGRMFKTSGVPNEVIQLAVQANPWFTPYYVRHSLESMLSWFEPEVLGSFLAGYAPPVSTPRKVGIIMAGNLPFVGIHDLLVTILSGNIAYVKPSHQDEILIQWFCERWQALDPSLENRIRFTRKLDQVEALIATGSNNSARYFEAMLPQVPKLIRRNRSSVAIIDDSTDSAQIRALMKDIFLYNGLGCRSVSTLWLHQYTDLHPIIDALKEHPPLPLNPNYIRKINWERANLQTSKTPFQDARHILLQEHEQLKTPQMGMIYLNRWANETELANMITQNRQKLQCIVGLDTDFGASQQPAFDHFADGVDVMQWLNQLPL